MHSDTAKRLSGVIPFLWLAFSMIWAGVIFVTDLPAWPLAIWIATTVGPLTLLRSRQTTPDDRSSINHRGETP